MTNEQIKFVENAIAQVEQAEQVRVRERLREAAGLPEDGQ